MGYPDKNPVIAAYEKSAESVSPALQEKAKVEKINESLKAAKLKTYSQEDLDLIKEKDKPLYDKFLALDKGEEGVDLGQNLTETLAKLDSELAKHEKTSGSLKTTDDLTHVDLKDGEKTTPEAAEKIEEYPGQNSFEYFKRRLNGYNISDDDWVKMLEDISANALPGRGSLEWGDITDDKAFAESYLKGGLDSPKKLLKELEYRLRHPGRKKTGSGISVLNPETAADILKEYDFALLAVPSYITHKERHYLKRNEIVTSKNNDVLIDFIKSKNLSEEDWKFMLEDASTNGHGSGFGGIYNVEEGMFRGFRGTDGVESGYQNNISSFYKKYPTLDSYITYIEKMESEGKKLYGTTLIDTVQNYFPNGGTKETYGRATDEKLIPLDKGPEINEEPIETVADITRLNIRDISDPIKKEEFKARFGEAIDKYALGYGYTIKDDVKINKVEDELYADDYTLPKIIEENYDYTGKVDDMVRLEAEDDIKYLSDEVQAELDKQSGLAEKKEKESESPLGDASGDKSKNLAGGDGYSSDAGGSGAATGDSSTGTDVPSGDDDTEFVPDADAPKPDAQGGEAVNLIGRPDQLEDAEAPKESEKGLRSHDESLNILNDLAKWGFKANDKRNFKNRIEQNLKEKYKRDYGDHLQISLTSFTVKDGESVMRFVVRGEADSPMKGKEEGFILKGFAKEGADKTVKGKKEIAGTEIQDTEANRQAVKKMFQKSIFNGIFEPLVLDQTDVGFEDKKSELVRLAEYVKETYLDADKEKPRDRKRAAKYAGFKNKIQAEKALDASWTELLASNELSDAEKQKLKTLRNK